MTAPSTGIARLRSAFRPGRPSLVAYVPSGDPAIGDARLLETYREAGVAVLEIGIPTRDPWLDGTEVRESMQRALDAGVGARAIAERIARWRSALGAPVPAVVWFSYPDLPLTAVKEAASMSAIDGLLMLDPWRHPEADHLPTLLADLGLATCAFLPWHPTHDDRAAVRAATGYVMVQARPGTTGADRAPGDPNELVDLARRLAPEVPVLAGFGVRDATTARGLLGSGVDGVVAGSACIRAAREGGTARLGALLRELVDAIGPALPA